MSKISIYVATHKNFVAPKDDGYIPMFLGKTLHPEKEVHFLCDNVGDNISYLNKSFCELTAMYWMWKNDNSDIVGLSHYRRYFKANNDRVRDFFDTENRKNYRYDGDVAIASHNDFFEFNNNVDIIAASYVPAQGTIFENFENYHDINDMYLVREAIRRLFPDYVDAFDFFMKYHKLSNCNMFVARKEVIDKYFEWIFPIVFYLYEMKFYRNYTDYQARIFGFISERLFNVWLCKNREHFCVSQRDLEFFQDQQFVEAI